MFWLKFTPSNWACFRSSIRTNYNEEGRKEGRKMKTLGRFWNANQGGGGIQKYQQGWECSFPQLSSFFLSSNRFLPCTAGFFVLTDHKYLTLVLAQMVEHSDRQQKKKDPVKIKVRMVQAPVPPELVTAWESVWNHAGKKSHICPEGPANVTVFSCTHLSGPVECHSLPHWLCQIAETELSHFWVNDHE